MLSAFVSLDVQVPSREDWKEPTRRYFPLTDTVLVQLELYMFWLVKNALGLSDVHVGSADYKQHWRYLMW